MIILTYARYFGLIWVGVKGKVDPGWCDSPVLFPILCCCIGRYHSNIGAGSKQRFSMPDLVRSNLFEPIGVQRFETATPTHLPLQYCRSCYDKKLLPQHEGVH